MKSGIFASITTAILFTSSGWSQTVVGTQQGGLTNPSSLWNHHPFAMLDFTTGFFRVYWSCGLPGGICVGHLTSTGFYDGEPISTTIFPQFCDIQDPGVVKFQGTYYLYAGAIPAGSPGCGSTTANEHAAIYAFSSPNGVSSWSLLNGGNPVIKVPVDPGCFGCYTGHGVNFPNPVVMRGGTWIRVYHSWNAPGYGPTPDGLVAMDSFDGVNFSNQRLILGGGAFASSVKRVGLSVDYPMVMTYAVGSNRYSATSSWTSDTSWTLGNGGAPISTNPAAGYAPSLEGDQTGLFLNTGGGPFTNPVSGQLNFIWGDSFITGSRIYRGSGNAAQFFNF